MLGELCLNLLHNAIKNSCTGGALTVRTVTDGHYLALTISDSGPGISAEQATRLFLPFSAVNVHHGSGLGLALCWEITAALSGSMSLDNRTPPGQLGRVTGLDTTVRLPLLQIKVQNST
jgi:two-component system sensor histidine kinase TctE